MTTRNYSVESIASSKRKSKDNIRVENLIPSELRDKSAKLITLLKDYYTYLNTTGKPSYAINSINNERDLDTASSQYLDLIQKEIASAIPKQIVADRVKLYKNLIRYYSIRGSEDSITLFFKILFSDNVEVYYPQKDMLIPSSGNWDQTGRRPVYDNTGVLTGYEDGIYTDNKGFLSDTIKLQDSYFYQKFSYVIRTGNNVSLWKDSFNRLVHPAGFIFFGEILILLESVNRFSVTDDLGQDEQRIYTSMRKIQPGMISDKNLPRKYIIEIVEGSAWATLSDALFAPGYVPGEIIRGSTSGATAIMNSYITGTYDSLVKGNMFMVMISGTFLPGEYLTGDDSGTSKQLDSIWLNQDTMKPYYRDQMISAYLDIPSGADQAELMHYYDSAPTKFYDNITIDDAPLQYLYGDYTISQVINTSITQNGIHLGVTLI